MLLLREWFSVLGAEQRLMCDDLLVAIDVCLDTVRLPHARKLVGSVVELI